MKRWIWVALLSTLGGAVPAGASTFFAMSQKQMVAQAQAVVVGEVLQVNSFWSPSGRLILSEATLKVEDTVFGEAPSVVVLRTAGGQVGNFRVEAHGFPTFRAGERLLLFVGREQDGVSQVVGYRQGQYRVVTNKAGVELAVPTLEAETAVITPDGRPAPRIGTVRLEVLKNALRDEARRAGRLGN